MSYYTEFGSACRWAGVSDSDRGPWLAERRKHITGTDVAAILGLHPFRTALDVYVDKTVEAKPDADGDWSEAMRWGKILEAPIASEFARRFSRRMLHGGELLVSRTHTLLAVTLDAEQYREDRPDPGVYEGKTTSAWRSRDWNPEEPPPDYVQIQVQTELIVTMARWADVFCLIGGQRPVCFEIEPLDELQEMIVEASVAFWRDHVEARVPPEPTANDAGALARMYPEEDGSRVLLPVEASVWSAQYAALGIEIRELKAEREEYKNRIKAAMGSASFGVLPIDTADGKGLWKWVAEERKAHHVKASKSRVPRLVKPDAQAKLLRAEGKPPELPPTGPTVRAREKLRQGDLVTTEGTRATPAKRRRSKRR